MDGLMWVMTTTTMAERTTLIGTRRDSANHFYLYKKTRERRPSYSKDPEEPAILFLWRLKDGGG